LKAEENTPCLPTASDGLAAIRAGAFLQAVLLDAKSDPLDQQIVAFWAVGIFCIFHLTGHVPGVDEFESGSHP
jgi:hypothetical protein